MYAGAVTVESSMSIVRVRVWTWRAFVFCPEKCWTCLSRVACDRNRIVWNVKRYKRPRSAGIHDAMAPSAQRDGADAARGERTQPHRAHARTNDSSAFI